MAAGSPAPPAGNAPAAPGDAPAADDTRVDLRYPGELTGRSGQPASPRPAAADEVPPITPPAAPPPVTEALPPPPDPAPASGRAGPPASGQTAPPAASQPERPAPPTAASGWFVQVGAYRSREGADKVARDLSGQGHTAFVSPSGGLNRVRVGPFADRAAADRAAAEIARAGHPSPRVVREGS
jgi:cell division septation protein DedD